MTLDTLLRELQTVRAQMGGQIQVGIVTSVYGNVDVLTTVDLRQANTAKILGWRADHRDDPSLGDTFIALA